MTYKKTSIAEQVEQDHACLKRDMGEIHEDILREVADEDFSDWKLEFMWRLRDFRNRLCKHFDLEEEGGFMNEIIDEAPERLNRVKELEAEHDQILSDLDAILAVLKIMEIRDAAKIEDVRRRVIQLLSTLRTHESAENELIQRVYYREHGYPS